MKPREAAGLRPARFHSVDRLAAHVSDLGRGRARLMAGIAGIPGSGKSTLAGLLRDAIDRLAARPGSAAVVPQDGFHFTNAELERRGLADRKGSPWTFDASALLETLRAIRRGDGIVRVPVYSRELHEPVPDAVAIGLDTRFVLVEGNYLFGDQGVWLDIAGLFDVRIFVVATPAEARERVIARHIRGGLSPEAAAGKYARNDRPNSEWVAPTICVADCVYGIKNSAHETHAEHP